MEDCYLEVDNVNDVARYLDEYTFFNLKYTCKLMGHELRKGFIQNASIRTNKIVHTVIKKRKNVFITGPAGCGKTYTVQKIIERGKKYDLNIEVTSTTGISACHFDGGKTLHSFARLRLAKMKKSDIQDRYDDSGRVYGGKKHWIKTDILVIDEVSMLGSRFFEKINLCAQLARGSNKVFGGLQVVLCGDFLQLPPVMDSYLFTSPDFMKIKMITYQMEESVRQNGDMRFFNLLNRVRKGELTDRDIDILQSKVRDSHTMVPDLLGFISPVLYPTNKMVNDTNISHFSSIHTEIVDSISCIDMLLKRVYNPTIKKYEYQHYMGNMGMNEALRKLSKAYSSKYPVLLEFKENVQYFLTANIDVEGKMVNGSLCLYKDGGLVFRDGNKLKIVKETHEFRQNKTIGYIHRFLPIEGDIFLLRKQIPLKLGYAVTIHSSQGMTLDEARIDIGKSVFTASQSYVALSRLRNLDGVSLSQFDPKKIRAPKKALEYYKQLFKD